MRLFAVVFLLAGCAHLPQAERDYYAALNAELKAKKVGRPVVMIDLDVLDANLAVVQSHLQAPLKFRAVEKSLPSTDLLAYILEKTGSHRVMVFHHPFLKRLLGALPPDTDFLFGKTIPLDGLESADALLSPEERSRVQWLIDTPATLEAYVKHFRATGGHFNANVELDVGLHRGGAETVAELEPMLVLLRANKDVVTLTGFMGYDGHAYHLPVPDFMTVWATKKTLASIQRDYQAMWSHVQASYPDLAATVTTLNGGGSSTYSLYQPDSVISDLSLGSALLKPRTYDLLTLEEHKPAVFIATPVLKKLHPAKLPFLGRISWSASVDGYYIYGGGWSQHVEYPEGLEMHALMVSPPNQTLVSNQAFLYGAATPGVQPGDFVFFRPGESDNFFLFDEIQLIRGGKLVGTWKPFPERY